MTDKQEPDIVERLRKYPADPTMCDDYSAAMLDAADEIERLREKMSMMAQYGKPPAQPAEYGECDECDTPYSFDPTDGGTICVRCMKEKLTNLQDAQPAPAQEPQPVSNTDELPQRLSDERIMHFWDIHAGMPTEKYPLNYKDVRAFARAIEAAIVPQWLPIESAPKDHTEILLSNGENVSSGAWFTGEDDHEAQWMDWSGGMLPEPTHWMPLPDAPKASHDPR